MLILLATSVLAAETTRWEDTLDRVAPAVVAIEVTATREFDTESSSNSVGTGFVVDAEAGLVLTNRHMVHAGPVTARATFLDNEEVELIPIYRDPVHDFGFYRFDPDALRHMEVVDLTLAPDAVRVGMEIRVIGNDAGEKLSILDGTIARVDRNAPNYGGNRYNDFNTFYIQAASNTSGGSSGSPVVDIQGRVIALNAGGNSKAASSFYLPLPRVHRALELIRDGRPIPRGTLTTTLRHASYDELRRVGLGESTEASHRTEFPDASGMLIVHGVLPGSAAYKQLRAGDVLVSIDGQPVADFVTVESRLDAAVGEEVVLELERLGTNHSVTLPVTDLHDITPDSYTEIGRATIHDLSYQQARNHHLPLNSGVFVAGSGYMFGSSRVSSDDIITHINGTAVPDVETFADVIATHPDRARVRVRHAPLDDVQNMRESVVTVDRTWYAARSCVRDDEHGTWPCTPLAAPPPASVERPGGTLLPATGGRLARKLAPALVLVDFDVPYSTSGVSGTSFFGHGSIIDAEQGLVLVDRDTVPAALGDLTITFGGVVRIPGEVVYLHPQHNFGIVRYDPEQLGDIEVSEVEFSDAWFDKGDELQFVGVDSRGRIVDQPVDVRSVFPVFIGSATAPQFRDVNVEVGNLAKVTGSVGGVLTDRRGKVQALWASYYLPDDEERYFYALPSAYLRDTIEAIRAGRTPEVRDLGIELGTSSILDARERGLSDLWVQRFATAEVDKPVVFEVRRTAGGSPASTVLRKADLVVALNGEPFTRMRDLLMANHRTSVLMTVLRDGSLIEVRVPTVELHGRGVRRLVSWAGALMHEPTYEAALQWGIELPGVYIGWYWYGSPAARDGVRPLWRIVKLGDTTVADIDGFLAALKAAPPGAVVLTLENASGQQVIRAVTPDPAYWPAELIEWADGAWRRSAPMESVER